jgi:cell shape-determining protein MreD
MKKRIYRRRIFVSILIHVLLFLVVYALQDMILIHLQLFGLVPLLLPVAATGVAVFEGRDIGGIAGLFVGIMCDISFNAPVGVFTVLLTFTGLLVGTLADTVMRRGFLSFYIASVVVLVISVAAQMFPLVFFNGVPPQMLFMVAMRQTLYSMLFVFPMYPIVKSLGRRAGRILPPSKIR